MDSVVHFEIPYKESKRARHFYENVFGWDIKDSGMEGLEYFIATTGPTDKDRMPKEPGFISGGMTPGNDKLKAPVIAMRVDDIKKTLEKVEDYDGKRLMDPMSIGDMGYYTYVQDSEGSVIGIWQDKKK